MRKVLGAVIGALLIAGLASGCSNSMTKSDFKSELKTQMAQSGTPVPDKYIDCIVDNLEKAGFKFRKYGELSADENTQVTKAVTDCASTLTPEDLAGLTSTTVAS